VMVMVMVHFSSSLLPFPLPPLPRTPPLPSPPLPRPLCPAPVSTVRTSDATWTPLAPALALLSPVSPLLCPLLAPFPAPVRQPETKGFGVKYGLLSAVLASGAPVADFLPPNSPFSWGSPAISAPVTAPAPAPASRAHPAPGPVCVLM
jgi:hypothetical protein